MDAPFNIFEIDAAFIEKLTHQPPDAHFHEFEELLLVTAGGLEHYIDFQFEQVTAPAACYVSMGKMHRIVPQPNLQGWVITYKNEFIPNSQLNFYSNFFTSNTIPLTSSPCLTRFNALCQIIRGEFEQEMQDVNTIRHLTNGLVSMIDSERKRNIPIENTVKQTQIATFNTFLKLLEDNYRKDVGVAFYAEKMNMSERNLNLICKNNFQKSVSEIIETRKLIEAKQLLIHSTKSVSEICFELGYNEKSYFTRVFRSRMNYPPTEYRTIMQQQINHSVSEKYHPFS